MIDKILKFESIAIFALSLYLFDYTNYSWLFFVGLWIVPDIFMIGYTVSKKAGAYTYNLGHNYALPLLLLLIGHLNDSTLTLALAAIWLSHVSLDRFLGYGLKLEKGFQHTHLGIIGSKKK